MNEPGDEPAALKTEGDIVRDGLGRSAMDLVILFDWFTNESMDAALQATEWQQREMFLRLALMWAAAAQQCRNEAPTTQSSG